MADLQNLLVVPEFLTTHNAVEFLGRPMSFSVGVIGVVARANYRKRS